MGAAAVATMVTATCLSVPLNGWLQVGTFTCLLAAVALDVSRARLTHGATVSALGNWSTLLVDVLKRAVGMLAVAHAVAADASLASILFSINYHFGGCRLAQGAVDLRLNGELENRGNGRFLTKARYVGSKVTKFESSMLGPAKVEGGYSGFLSTPISKACV